MNIGQTIEVVLRIARQVVPAADQHQTRLFSSIRHNPDSGQIVCVLSNSCARYLSPLQSACRLALPNHSVVLQHGELAPGDEDPPQDRISISAETQTTPADSPAADTTVQDVFRQYFHTNYWGNSESVSGQGSTCNQTYYLAAALPGLLAEFCIGSLLDLPCGDFNWMQQVQIPDVKYVGADIVPELAANNQQFAVPPMRQFTTLDILSSDLPQADLVMVRDCLVHFSHQDVMTALNNLINSPVQWLLTTTFPGRRTNPDIATGQWRPLNLECSPYCLPRPLRLISERCTEMGGTFADKSVALWHLQDVRQALTTASLNTSPTPSP
jgi:hypothetical protein